MKRHATIRNFELVLIFAFGFFVFGVGAATCTLYMLGSEQLSALTHTGVPMAIPTALCFVLTGLAIFLVCARLVETQRRIEEFKEMCGKEKGN